jgi:Raf kinase inhibitor-like YbhB/YbcL family protein
MKRVALAMFALLALGATMKATLNVSSSAFKHQGAIPAKYTCEGDDRSPPLTVAGVPPNAKTLALVIEDPDAPDPAAPKRTWAHWVAYDLPPSTRDIQEGAGNGGKLGRSGKNDWDATGYRGPCPPIGKHRYFLKFFALDRELGDLHEPTRPELLKAMEGHVIATGELMGTYQKSK